MPPPAEPLSPELVLVAPPEEARRAREQLADEPPLVGDVALERPREDWDDLLARLRAEPLPPVADEPPARIEAPKRRRWGRVAVAVAVVVLAVLIGVAWVRRDSQQPRLVGPTSASPPAAGNPVKPPAAPAKPKTPAKKPAATKPRVKPKPAAPVQRSGAKKPVATKPRVKPKPAAPVHRRSAKKPARPPAGFVPSRVWSWAPVPGSTGYRVRFFRNGRSVLVVRTATARLVLPKSFAFHKGRYRWTVVPLGAAKPQRPVVDSTFVVARG
jgi:hypothetical protein